MGCVRFVGLGRLRKCRIYWLMRKLPLPALVARNACFWGQISVQIFFNFPEFCWGKVDFYPLLTYANPT